MICMYMFTNEYINMSFKVHVRYMCIAGDWSVALVKLYFNSLNSFLYMIGAHYSCAKGMVHWWRY